MGKKTQSFRSFNDQYFFQLRTYRKRCYLSTTPGHVKGKFVVDPFPKTQATPESVYLNLHTNNDKKDRLIRCLSS